MAEPVNTGAILELLARHDAMIRERYNKAIDDLKRYGSDNSVYKRNRWATYQAEVGEMIALRDDIVKTLVDYISVQPVPPIAVMPDDLRRI